MSVPEPSRQVVFQRIRNRIIEVLECLSSFDAQREYARRVPICYVPYELINSWADFVHSSRPKDFTGPVFSAAERDAIERFYSALDAASDALPDDFPPLERVLKEPYWARLREAAETALATFAARGKLSEDVEAA
jgi:hypothetical protein